MITSGQVVVSTSPTVIFTATGKTKIRIRNGNSTIVLVGDYGVAAPNVGWPTGYDPGVLDIAEHHFTLQAGDSLYGVSVSGSQVVQFLAES